MSTKLILGDNLGLEGMQTLQAGSVDVIATDPPYLYLKNQKLDRVFDESETWKQLARLLKDTGFISLFGRGSSFYRWNYTLEENFGFNYKETIIWDKRQCTSPLMKLSRIHEEISIHAKKYGSIEKVKVPYLEMKSHDWDGMFRDMKRLLVVLKNDKSLAAVLSYIENNVRDTSDSWSANNLSISSSITKEDRQVSVARSMKAGMTEKTIVRTDFERPNHARKAVTAEAFKESGDRQCNCFQSIMSGMNEKSIINNQITDTDTLLLFIKLYYFQLLDICEEHGYDTIYTELRNHYHAIHPTEKPIALWKRILKLMLKKGVKQTVLDPFAGSFSLALACFELNNEEGYDIDFIGYEIDKEYYDKGVERYNALAKSVEPQLNFIV